MWGMAAMRTAVAAAPAGPTAVVGVRRGQRPNNRDRTDAPPLERALGAQSQRLFCGTPAST